MGNRDTGDANGVSDVKDARTPDVKRKCRGVTADGKPCNSSIVGESGYCRVHDPALRGQVQAQRILMAGYGKPSGDQSERPSTGMRTSTPARAIRCYCIDCVGSMDDVEDCKGFYVATTQKPCPLYPWRFGCRPETAAKRGHDIACNAPPGAPLKAIRYECMSCCCGSPKQVSHCPSTACPLWPYRFGQTPATARKHGKRVDPEAQTDVDA